METVDDEFVKYSIKVEERYMNGEICFDEMHRLILLKGKGEYEVKPHLECARCKNLAVCAKKYGFTIVNRTKR